MLRDCLRPGESQHSIPTSTQSTTEVHIENRQNEEVLLGLSGHHAAYPGYHVKTAGNYVRMWLSYLTTCSKMLDIKT